jgi:predicted RNase H-like HicB family nuclease
MKRNTLHLTAVIWREGKFFVARCPETGVASYGKSPTLARKALREAVELWVSNARRLGMFEELRPALETEEKYTTRLDVAI